MEKEKGFIGCTKCYKRKKDCECVLPDLHIIHKRAWYYSKFGFKPKKQKNKENGKRN